MNKKEAKERISHYLKEYNINNRLINDHQRPMRDIDLDTFYLYFNLQSPAGGIECDVRLYDNKMHVRAYYTENVAEKCKMCSKTQLEMLTRTINYINANVFFESLYTPRLYLSTDGFYDLAITTVIPYDFFELAPIETLEYITCYYPECMEKFAIPLCGIIYGKLNVPTAIYHIKKEILGEDDAVIEWEGND